MKKILIAGAWIAGILNTGLAQQDRTGWPNELNFGVIPVEGSGDATARMKIFVEYLSKTLGIKVNTSIGADYAAVILAMGSKKVDIGYFGPASYVQAAEQAGAEAFAKEDAIESGTGYNSILIVKTGGPIKKLEDAKGQDFAFVDPNSTSGYLVPMTHFLKDLNLKPDQYFKRVIFGGTHEANILSVANGKVPIAATNNLDLEKTIIKGEIKRSDVTILWTSPTIPGAPLAYRKDLPTSLKEAIRNAVLSFKDPEGLKALGLKSYVAASDKEYDVIRQLNEVKKQLLGK